MSDNPLELDRFTIRRQVFRLFGAGFQIFDAQQREVAFSDQKAFRLKEDIRIHAGESGVGGEQLLGIRARHVVDFSASYDVVDSVEQTKIGVLRRKGFSSMTRDSWEILDADDRPVGTVREDSVGMALVRRLLSNLVPQTFHVEMHGQRVATMKQRFNPFIYKLDCERERGSELDGRMLVAAACLIAAIEGRQD